MHSAQTAVASSIQYRMTFSSGCSEQFVLSGVFGGGISPPFEFAINSSTVKFFDRAEALEATVMSRQVGQAI